MSDLLPNIRDHLQTGNLLEGYQVQFYRWTDAAGTPTFVIRRAGTNGESDYLVQRPDVRLILITAGATDVRAGEIRMYEVLRYLRHYYRSAGVVHYEPMSGVIGPNYLEDGRGVFELDIRCLTDDQ